MLRVLGLAVLITLSVVHNGDANMANQSSAVASELTQIEHRLVKAWIEGDRAPSTQSWRPIGQLST